MDRQLVYPGAIPLDTDPLNIQRNVMVGLSKLAAAMLGTTTLLNGLACTPTSPASLQVYVAPGEIYSLQNLDGTAYGSLAADTTHQIVKQGILLDQATLSCPAPGTAGQSINYLIQVAYQDTDTTPVVLPYYNASNPSTAYSGPNNAGTTNNTQRKGQCIVAVKAGTAATTGSQTTPAPDAGYVGAWVVTVANGQATITSSNISAYPNAPMMPAGGLLVGGLQGSAANAAAAAGTSDAITATFTPGITALVNGMTLYVRAGSANSTATPTFTPASGIIGALTIVKGNGLPLVAGDIAGGGHWIELQYDLTLNKWVLQNPANGVAVPGRLLNLQVFAASGTYTPTTGTNSVVVEVIGGGGAGGGAPTTGAGACSIGGGGGAGGYAKKRITSGFSGVTVTVGAGGTPASGVAGGNGGTTSFGALVSATGGTGGTVAGASGGNFTANGGAGAVAGSSGNVNVGGQAGGLALGLYAAATTYVGGFGAPSAFGGGGFGATNGVGGAGAAPGAGGGGSSNGPSAAASLGGAGGAGLVLVWEYA